MKKLFCCALVALATISSQTAEGTIVAANWFGRQKAKTTTTQQSVQTAPKAASIQWLTDFDEATRRARAEQKPLFILFEGSDWCPWCMRLENEVLQDPTFSQNLQEKFIFVNLDFPRRKPQPPELAKQNQQLKQQYSVKGFPTVLILDPQQKQIGTTGYRSGGAKAYVDHINDMIESR